MSLIIDCHGHYTTARLRSKHGATNKSPPSVTLRKCRKPAN
ncbi:hypothetical protein [Neisseria weixii]|nr:hypothetical protein [Neisseria weixii]